MNSVTLEKVRRPRSRPRRWERAIPIIVFLLAFVIVAAGIILVFGRIHGEEFSPEVFQRRQYRFYQIPIVRWQISPVVRKDISNALEERIAADIQGAKVGDPRVHWDLVTSIRNARNIYEGDAKILCDSLSFQNSRDVLVWNRWTDKHQPQAKVLWPIVVKTAQARLYVLIPELLELAKAADDEAQLSNSIHEYLIREGGRIADDYQAVGDFESALATYDFVLDVTASPDVLQAKKLCQEAARKAGGTVDSPGPQKNNPR